MEIIVEPLESDRGLCPSNENGGSQKLWDITAEDGCGRPFPLRLFRGYGVLFVKVKGGSGIQHYFTEITDLYIELVQRSIFVVVVPSCGYFQRKTDNRTIQEDLRFEHGIHCEILGQMKMSGKKTHPLIKWLTSKARGKGHTKKVASFTKFLVLPDGSTVIEYPPRYSKERILESIQKKIKSPLPT